MSWWVYIQQCHLRLASQRVSIVLILCCTQVVIMAPTVDWSGLLACCNICWFFPGWRHLHRGCWSLCGECGLLHTGVHLLWLWGFLIGISAWWLCWTCWHNPTVRYHSSILVWLSLCILLICFLWIDGIFFPISQFTSFTFLFLIMCSFQFSLQSKCKP